MTGIEDELRDADSMVRQPDEGLSLYRRAADELAKRPAERNAVREQCAVIAENELDGDHAGNRRARQIADLIRASKEPEFNVGASAREV